MVKSSKTKKRDYSKQNKPSVSRVTSWWCAITSFLGLVLCYTRRLQCLNPFYIIKEKQRQLYYFDGNGVVSVQPKLKERFINIFLTERKRREKILNWVNMKIPQQNVQDFSESWNDGIALCALLNAIRPGVCPGFHHLKHHNRVNNCRLGIKLARQCLELPQDMMQPEEMAIADKTSEPKILKYISMIKWASEIAPSEINVPQDILMETQIPTCIVKGSGIDSGILGRKARFTLSTMKFHGMFHLNIDIKDPKCEIYSETIVSLHQTGQLVTGRHVRHPSTVTDAATVDNSIMEYLEDGFGNTFIRWKNIKYLGDAVTYNNSLSVDVKCCGEGVFFISYLPILAGIHTVSIRWRNVHIDGSPFKVKIYQPRDQTRRTIKDAKDKRVIFQSLSLSSIDERPYSISVEENDHRKYGRYNDARKKMKSDRLSTSKIRKQYTVTKRRVIRKVVNRNGEEIVIHESPSPSLSRQSSFTDTSTEDEVIRKSRSLSPQRLESDCMSPSSSEIQSQRRNISEPTSSALGIVKLSDKSSSVSSTLKGTPSSQDTETKCRNKISHNTTLISYDVLISPETESTISDEKDVSYSASRGISRYGTFETEIRQGRKSELHSTHHKKHARSHSDSSIYFVNSNHTLAANIDSVRKTGDVDGTSKLFALKLLKSDSNRKSCCYISDQIIAGNSASSLDSMSSSSNEKHLCSACESVSLPESKKVQDDQVTSDDVFCNKKSSLSTVNLKHEPASYNENLSRDSMETKMVNTSPKSSVASYTESDDSSLFSSDVKCELFKFEDKISEEFACCRRSLTKEDKKYYIETPVSSQSTASSFAESILLTNTKEDDLNELTSNLKTLECQQRLEDKAARYRRSTMYWLENQTTDQFSLDLPDDIVTQSSAGKRENLFPFNELMETSCTKDTPDALIQMDSNTSQKKDSNACKLKLINKDNTETNQSYDITGYDKEPSVHDVISKDVKEARCNTGNGHITVHLENLSSSHATSESSQNNVFFIPPGGQILNTELDLNTNASESSCMSCETNVKNCAEAAVDNEKMDSFYKKNSISPLSRDRKGSLQRQTTIQVKHNNTTPLNNKKSIDNHQTRFQSICPGTMTTSKVPKPTKRPHIDILIPKFKTNKSTQVHVNDIIQETQFLSPLLGIRIVRRKSYFKNTFTPFKSMFSFEKPYIQRTKENAEDVMEEASSSRLHDQSYNTEKGDAFCEESDVIRWIDKNKLMFTKKPIRQSTVDTIDSGISEGNHSHKLFTFCNNGDSFFKSIKEHQKIFRRPYQGQIDLDPKLVMSGSNSDSHSVDEDTSNCFMTIESESSRKRQKTSKSFWKRSVSRRNSRRSENFNDSRENPHSKGRCCKILKHMKRSHKRHTGRRKFGNTGDTKCLSLSTVSDSSKEKSSFEVFNTNETTNSVLNSNDKIDACATELSVSCNSNLQEELDDGFGVSVLERDDLLRCINEFKNINIPISNSTDKPKTKSSIEITDIHQGTEKQTTNILNASLICKTANAFISTLTTEIKPGKFVSSIEKDIMPTYVSVMGKSLTDQSEQVYPTSQGDVWKQRLPSLSDFSTLEHAENDSSSDNEFFSKHTLESADVIEINDVIDDGDVLLPENGFPYLNFQPVTDILPYESEDQLDTFYCKAEGIGLSEGQVGTKNNFQIWTDHQGNGSISVTIYGPRSHSVLETSIVYTGDNLYEVIYEVTHPGFYVISIKWGEISIQGSPFLCKISY